MKNKVVKYFAFKWPQDVGRDAAKQVLGKKTDEFLKAFFEMNKQYTLVRTWDKSSDEGYVFFFEVENNGPTETKSRDRKSKGGIIIPH